MSIQSKPDGEFNKDESGLEGYVALFTVFGVFVLALGHLIGVVVGVIR